MLLRPMGWQKRNWTANDHPRTQEAIEARQINMTDNIIWKIKPHFEKLSAENEQRRDEESLFSKLREIYRSGKVNYHGDPLPSDSEPDGAA